MQTKSIVIILCALIIVAVVGYYIGAKGFIKPNDDVGGYNDDDEAVFCTMDAKMCPDGTYVGRTGPKCEFATCPGN